MLPEPSAVASIDSSTMAVASPARPATSWSVTLLPSFARNVRGNNSFIRGSDFLTIDQLSSRPPTSGAAMHSTLRRLGLLALLAVTACSPASAPAPTTTQQGSAPAPAAEQRADVQSLRIAVRGMVGGPTPAASNGDQHMY